MVGPHFAAAQVGRHIGDDDPDAGRTFDYVLTHDRDTVLDVAQPLTARTLPVVAGSRQRPGVCAAVAQPVQVHPETLRRDSPQQPS